jgi:phospholipid/cholesterol/gamma-HCH transport system substrate-binding protein
VDPKVNYTVVGLFVVALIIIAIVAAIWLSGGPRKQYDTYLVLMNEPVSGLSEQALVRFNGVDVGYVSSVKLNPKDPQQVLLILKVDTDVPINQSTSATLMMQGITGITYIGLSAKAAEAPPLEVTPGYDYPIIQSSPSLLMELDAAVRDVTTDIKKFTRTIDQLFDEENQTAIKNTLQNLQQITRTISNNSMEIDTSLKNLNQTLKSAVVASGQLPDTLQNISQQALPEFYQTMSRFANVLTNLEQFTNDLQANPSILIRGQQLQPLGPGEK